MSATNFNTENRTYRQLLGNGLTYRIPRFQRDYSWSEEEWEDLWQDMLGTMKPDGEPAHYMGYLVLQTSDNRIFGVIDGQQRLTTISLIVLAAMRLLKRLIDDDKQAQANQQRLEQLRATYIGYLDPVTLTARNKLSLNRNNDDYYKDYLVTLADNLPVRGFAASTHSMRKGFEWFEKKLREHIKSMAEQGMELARFVETMSDKLFFTVITVADELNAYKVFETLNARGVRLSSTDLLKNWLFSILAHSTETDTPTQLGELERRWDNMVGRLGSESFPDFLRMHWNSRHPFARQAELFKTIRNHVSDPKQVFDLLRTMDQDIDTYLALTQPENSDWQGTWRESAQELRMFSVRQPFPMLMAAKRCLNDQEFGKLLRATTVISFRYNVIGSQHTGEQERHFHAAGIALHQGHVQTSAQVVDILRPLYRSDTAFRADFAEKSIKTTQSRNAKIVRYVLCKLERHAGGIDFDANSPVYTIEHILPQSPDRGWDAFADRDLEGLTYRLANMVMLEASINRDLGNQSFDLKRQAFAASSLKLTRDVATDHAEWTPERLQERQKAMAKMATSVWRLGS